MTSSVTRELIGGKQNILMPERAPGYDHRVYKINNAASFQILSLQHTSRYVDGPGNDVSFKERVGFSCNTSGLILVITAVIALAILGVSTLGFGLLVLGIVLMILGCVQFGQSIHEQVDSINELERSIAQNPIEYNEFLEEFKECLAPRRGVNTNSWRYKRELFNIFNTYRQEVDSLKSMPISATGLSLVG